MSLLVVGLSHRTATTADLERAAVTADEVPKTLHDLLQSAEVAEAVVLSTCNRTEIYADVASFHGGVAEVTDQLTRVTGVPMSDLSPQLYVQHEARVVAHLFSVVCGLDSMLVGETQILGQVRSAFRAAQAEGASGTVLGSLFQTALRVGKRAQSETMIGAAGASIVGVGLRAALAVWDARAAAEHLLPETPAAAEPAGPAAPAGEPGARPGSPPPAGSLAGRRVLIVGAGAVGTLAAAQARAAGAEEIVIANRGEARGRRLAEAHGGRAVGLPELEAELARAELVVSSTGSTGLVITAELVAAARAASGPEPGLVFLDLALPRDVDPGVRELPGVRLIDLDTLREALAREAATADIDTVRDLVAAEVGAFLDRRRAQRVAPTVIALRAQAAAVVRDELDRLHTRLPDLDARDWANVEGAMRRVVDKLLHAPTVRVQQLATSPDGDSYAEALRELFDLPRQAPAVVSAPDLGEAR